MTRPMSDGIVSDVVTSVCLLPLADGCENAFFSPVRKGGRLNLKALE